MRAWQVEKVGSITAGVCRGAWQPNCCYPARGERTQNIQGCCRLAPFRRWLLARPESNIAIVAHYGSINNLINMEPFQRDKREPLAAYGLLFVLSRWRLFAVLKHLQC